MNRFSCHSARLNCEKLSTGVVNLSIYGLVTHEGFDKLYDPACRYALGAPAVVARIDTALLCADGDLMTPDYPGTQHFPAVALVVPPERYEWALGLSRAVAAKWGVTRLAFLPEQLEAAHRWAAHVARSQTGLLLQRPQ